MIRFGTDGIRGPAGQSPINVAGALAVGRAAARLAEGGPVLVARDRRPSGPALEAAVVAGVCDGGSDALVTGILPTAGASEAVAQGIGKAAVVLTASHNQAADNGFKILAGGGHKPTDDEVARVEGWLAEDRDVGRLGAVSDVRERALGAHTRALDARIDRTSFRGQRVAVDLANGAAVALRPWLEQLDLDWTFVAAGEGVENDNCGAVHPEQLGEAVRRSGARLGLAVDGDADRCVLVDERGRRVHGDVLGWWLVQSLGVRSLAVTVMSTHALEPVLDGVKVVRTAVGDRHLQAAMRTHGLSLGIEESGHALFADGLPTGCGLLTGLRAVSSLLADDRHASRVLGEFEPWPRVTSKVGVTSRPPLESIPELVSTIGEIESGLGGGRTLLRYSGTEPILRILVEGPDAASVAAAGERLEQVARDVLA